MGEYFRVGRPGALGSRKEEVLANYDKLFGKDKWRLVWDVKGRSVDREAALQVYENAYFDYFRAHRDELVWIVKNYENIYDNNPSNVASGTDYTKQEFGGNHYQDIAIRRVVERMALSFAGKGLLEIRTTGIGAKWGPAHIPFPRPEFIPQPAVKGWWDTIGIPNSLESWYQSAKYLEVKELPEKLLSAFLSDIIFVTGNNGKLESARKTLPHLSIAGVPLVISEKQHSVDEIAKHKAKVGYAVLCKPVITDDSGFFIPHFNGWPGARVGRELEARGLEWFTELAGMYAPLQGSWDQALAYYDSNLVSPKLFKSMVPGTLIDEARGQKNPWVKSNLGLAFIIEGMDKTIGELTEEEYKARATTNRWQELAEFLSKR